MFLNAHPPKDKDLWVVHSSLNTAMPQHTAEHQGAVICFTPGTQILTPDGARLI